MTSHHPRTRLAAATAALLLPTGLLLAAGPAGATHHPQAGPTISSDGHAAKPDRTATKAPKSAQAAAAKAVQAAKKASRQARQAAKAATAADAEVKKRMARALKARDRAAASGTAAAKKRNATAWEKLKAAQKARTKAERKAGKASAAAARLEVVAKKKVAKATTVTAVRVHVLPPIAQPGADIASADAALVAVTAYTTPAIAYLPVSVEAQTPSGWQPVARTVTDDQGLAQVQVPAHTAYRAVSQDKTSAAGTLTSWKLGFSDEFTTAALGPAWTHRGSAYDPESLRACSKGDPSAAQVDGDALRLWVLRDPARTDLCPALRKGAHEGPYAYRLNGHVSTEESYSFTYGVAAARMKFQPLAGQHASFWLQPTSSTAGGHGPEFTGAEIDVVEWFGPKKSGGITQFTYHDTAAGDRVKTGGHVNDVNRFLAGKSDSWFDAYHVFSVEWTPKEYIFRIDGRESWRSGAGISHRPQALILSLLSSDYEIAAAGDASLGTQHTDVDWVRVWQNN